MDPTLDAELNTHQLFVNVIENTTEILMKDVDQSAWSAVTVQCTELAYEANVKTHALELAALELFVQSPITYLYVLVPKVILAMLLEFVVQFQYNVSLIIFCHCLDVKEK